MAFSVGRAMSILAGCAGYPTVRTPAQAITIAKRLCGQLIPPDHASSQWTAVIDDGHEVFWNIPNGVWRVGTRFDDSHGNVMSLVDTMIFIPKVGKPSGCIQVSN